MTHYAQFLERIGLTQAQMDAAAAAFPPTKNVGTDDQHAVQPSAINGVGLFSGADFDAGDRVCTLRNGATWTTCGRFINHAAEPNVRAVVEGQDCHAIAVIPVCKGVEITLDYEQIRVALQ